MKRLRLLLIVTMVGLTLNCGSNPKTKDQPAHLTAGMQAMHKGIAAYQHGCYRRSLDHLLRAHEAFAASDQLEGVAMSMNNIGNVYRFIGDPESAHLFFDQAIAMYLELHDEDGALQALSNKAALLIDINELNAAQETLQRADQLLGEQKATASLLNTKGVLSLKQHAYDEAEALLKQGLDRLSDDDPVGVATLNFSLGRLMVATNRLDLAREYFETALQTDRKLGFHKGIADDLAAIGDIYLTQGQFQSAAAYLQRSIKIYALIENQERVEAILQKLQQAAAEADLDIRVTELFVKRWLDGKIIQGPCH